MSVAKDHLLVVKSNVFGEGEPDLGEKLLVSFLREIIESDKIPEKIIFMKSGIFLTTENSPIIDILMKLQERGSEIRTCGTCLKYYNRESKLVVGAVGNMKDTVECMQKYKKVIYI
jgi:selenium metabolism protein YedF